MGQAHRRIRGSTRSAASEYRWLVVVNPPRWVVVRWGERQQENRTPMHSRPTLAILAALAVWLAAPPPAALAQGCPAVCDRIYATDCNFGLWTIDPAFNTSVK